MYEVGRIYQDIWTTPVSYTHLVSVVKDEATGDHIVKLVNLLPVEVSSTVNPSQASQQVIFTTITMQTDSSHYSDNRRQLRN